MALQLSLKPQLVHETHLFETLSFRVFYQLRELLHGSIKAVKVCIEENLWVAIRDCKLAVA